MSEIKANHVKLSNIQIRLLLSLIGLFFLDYLSSFIVFFSSTCISYSSSRLIRQTQIVFHNIFNFFLTIQTNSFLLQHTASELLVSVEFFDFLHLSVQIWHYEALFLCNKICFTLLFHLFF